MLDKPKPCPHCGGRAERWAPDGVPYNTIVCTECNAEVSDCDTWEDCLAQHNRRASGWMSVKDKPLEDNSVRYFVVVTTGMMRYIAWRKNGRWIIHDPEDSGNDLCLGNVAEWMKLPPISGIRRIAAPEGKRT